MRAFAVIIVLILLLLLSVNVVVAGGDDENGNDEIILIPEEPTAGKNLIFYLPSVNISANGYVIFADNDVHLVEIRNSLGQVTLDGGDYGEATVKIFAGNKTYTKTFEVKPFLEGTLVIETPSSVLINTDVTIKVAVGATPAEGAVVTFKSLSGRTFNRIADGNGRITLFFDEDGPWEIQTEFYGVTASATIKVMLPPIEIVFPENIEANEEMHISIGSPADITITKNEITWAYQTDANGDLYFTPPWPGKYSVYVKTDRQEGSKTFITTSETRINVYDYEKSLPISKIKKDQLVQIFVVDSSGVPVSAMSEITVYCDGVLWKSLPLSDGSVVWMVDKEAISYCFKVEEIEGYEASEATVYIEEEGFPFEDIAFYAVLIIGILVVLIIFIRLLKKGRISLKFPKIFGRTPLNIGSKKLE